MRLTSKVLPEVLSCRLKQPEAALSVVDAREQELETAIALAVEVLSDPKEMGKKAGTAIQEKVKPILDKRLSKMELKSIGAWTRD